MNDDLTKDTSVGNTSAPAAEQAKQENQSTHQPADEEIGDYANPDAIQVDGGDNSFVADEDEKTGTSEKKPDAG
jgi:hypothetical protein